MSITLDRTNRQARAQRTTKRRPRWATLAQAAAAAWSLAYLGLALAWLAGAPGNPADPAVDEAAGLSVIGMWGPQTGAALLAGLAGLGVLLTLAIAVLRPAPGRLRAGDRLLALLAGALGLVLAIVLPDFRLLAATAYTPILLVQKLFGTAPDGVTWTWPAVNMGVLSLAGLAWIATAVLHHRRVVGACNGCGRGQREPAWTGPDAARRWGRWFTAIAVAVPLFYASIRFAWALGLPLGVSQDLLDELGDAVYRGAGLATLAVGGAVLTLGLGQRWGERFPRWMLGLRGRKVPVALAVVPAAVVSVVVTSAGLMFIRLAISGELAESFPGESSDIAAWLPEMFWPLWGAALAAATYAYWLRRRGPCQRCPHE